MSSKLKGRAIAATAGFIGGLAQATGDYTMGAQQQLLLLALYVHGNLNQLDLPKFTGVERSANSRNIARLGVGAWAVRGDAKGKTHQPGLGLVEAYQDPLDRRFNMVRLTPKGRATLEAVAEQVLPFIGE